MPRDVISRTAARLIAVYFPCRLLRYAQRTWFQIMLIKTKFGLKLHASDWLISPNRIPFDAKSIRKIQRQFKFAKIWKQSSARIIQHISCESLRGKLRKFHYTHKYMFYWDATLSSNALSSKEHWSNGTLVERSIGRTEHWSNGALVERSIGRTEH